MRNNKDDLISEVAHYYSEKLAQYGDTPQGVDWNSEEGQTLRFAQISKIIDDVDRFSLNDLGCGYGALLNFLSPKFPLMSYLGVDVSEDMVAVAQRRHQTEVGARFMTASEPDRVADFGVASGVFNVRLGRNNVEWFDYMEGALNILDRTSRRGFSFNCLTSYSDANRKRDYLLLRPVPIVRLVQAPIFSRCSSPSRLRVIRIHNYCQEMIMKRKLVIFGSGDIAQLAHRYFTTDSNYEPVAFTVDAAFIEGTAFCGLPVVAFEEVVAIYPPDHHDFFVALSYSKLNAVRREKYLAAKELGYRLASYISSQATVLNDGRIGQNCFIFEDNTIQPFVTIGNNVTLWSGNHIGHHSTIKDHTFIASHVVVSGGVEIGEQCFIGVNSTLRDHIRIGDRCVIGAGALLLADAEPEGVYVGAATERSKVPSSKLRKI